MLRAAILRRRRWGGLGPNLVANGYFDADTTGWVGIDAETLLYVIGGQLRVENGDATQARAHTTFATEIGRTYNASIDVGTSDQNPVVRCGTVPGALNYYGASIATRPATIEFSFVATTTETSITFYTGSATAGNGTQFDNVIVRAA